MWLDGKKAGQKMTHYKATLLMKTVSQTKDELEEYINTKTRSRRGRKEARELGKWLKIVFESKSESAKSAALQEAAENLAQLKETRRIEAAKRARGREEIK